MSDIENTLIELNNLADGLVEDILNTSDEEILREVKEEYGNTAHIANSMRMIVEKSKMVVARKRFDVTRDEMNAFRDSTASSSIENPDLSQLSDLETIAARDGKQIPNEDRDGLIDDLRDLKNMQKK